MTFAGARGETEKQMAPVFHFGTDQPQLHQGFSQLQRGLAAAEKQKGIELSIANALWAQRGDPFRAEFLKLASRNYEASTKQADFKTEAEPVRAEINQWISQKTKDKIKDILPPGSINELTRLVLANAIYFKGKWQSPFNPGETSPQPFHVTGTSQVNVRMMYHEDRVNYMENADLQAVELPYVGEGLSMVALLPREIEGCAPLENRLDASFLSQCLSGVSKQKVVIFLPKFKLQSQFDLKPVLAGMGMTDAFTYGRADFSGMDGTHQLFISDVFHKAWVDVSEEGTEAAAATATPMTKGIHEGPRLPVFRADHPFIFVIRETRTGRVLFLGRLADPSK